MAIFDADKQGFLRSKTSLIQVGGRAARNINGEIIMYADTVTPQMQGAIDETDRRRVKQAEYNKEHDITPETIRKAIRRGLELELKARKTARTAIHSSASEKEYDRDELIEVLEQEMLAAAEGLEFEKAAKLRDRLAEIKAMPNYGSSKKFTLDDVEAPKARPGMARSRAGITSKSKKSRG